MPKGHYFWLCLWVFQEEISMWTRYEVKHCGWASSNLLRAWVEQKHGGGLNSLCLTIFELGQWSFLPSKSWFIGLQTQTGIYTRGSLALRSSNYTTSFPGSLARQRTIELLSLYNHVDQYFITNIHTYISIYMYVCSVSLENPDWCSS